MLGFIRDQNFLPVDDDIDFIIPRSQIDLLYNIINNNKMDIAFQMVKPNIVQLFVKNEILPLMDIYIYDDLINQNKILIRWDGNLIYPRDAILPAKQISFHQHTVYIPNDPEKILRLTYGLNWEIPINKTQYKWKNITLVERISEKNVIKLLRIEKSKTQKS